MKNIIKKYNYAFGYAKSTLVTAGLAGIIAIVLALILMISGNLSVEEGIILLISGAIVTAIGVLVLLHTRSKCPLGKQGLIGLALSMCAVALGYGFVFAFRTIGKMLGIHVSSGDEPTKGYASFYIRESDHASCTLYSVLDERIATLHDEQGNSISVHRDSFGSDILYDDAGNRYRPR